MAWPEGRVNVCCSRFVFRRGSSEAIILNGRACLTSNKHNLKVRNTDSEEGASPCWVLSHQPGYLSQVLPQAKHAVMIAMRALLPSNTVRAVIRFWKTQAELFLLPDASRDWKRATAPWDSSQSLELFTGSEYLPSPLCMKQPAIHQATWLAVGRQLGFSFCCEHWMSFKGYVAGRLLQPWRDVNVWDTQLEI